MSAAKVYAHEVHEQVERYANWLPTDHIEVGAVGRLSHDIFHPEAHLKGFGIPFNLVKDPDAKATYKFMSSGTKEVSGSLSAGGVPTSVGTVAATLSVGFSRENSVYFLLTHCIGSAIDNLIQLGQDILKRVQRKEWELDYVVVTRVVTAGSATILQAQSKDASIVFEGDAAGSPVLDLLKAGAKVKVKSQSSIGISVVAESKLTPLLSLGKVKYNFFDWALGKRPKFSSYIAGHNSVGATRFYSIVDATPNIDLTTTADTKNDLNLDLTLAKYGDYIDIGNLLDLTSRASGTRVGNVARVQPSSRVSKAKLLSVVNKLPRVDVDSDIADDCIKLKVKLPKSGATINVRPLMTFAMNAAEPKPKATANAELSFDEIK